MWELREGMNSEIDSTIATLLNSKECVIATSDKVKEGQAVKSGWKQQRCLAREREEGLAAR